MQYNLINSNAFSQNGPCDIDTWDQHWTGQIDDMKSVGANLIEIPDKSQGGQKKLKLDIQLRSSRLAAAPDLSNQLAIY